MSDDSVLTQSHRDRDKPVNGKSVLTRSVDGRPAVTDRDKPVILLQLGSPLTHYQPVLQLPCVSENGIVDTVNEQFVSFRHSVSTASTSFAEQTRPGSGWPKWRVLG